jgi:putative nucleotidyltransferase with HDIG domain
MIPMNAINHKKDMLIEKIETLPTLPIISQKIMQLLSDDNVSNKALVDIIEKDQSLAVRVLRMANSSFYGFLSKVSSLEHALSLLGLNEIKSIVLASSVYSFFSNGKKGDFDRTRFWKHSIICSQTARYLGNYFKVANDDSLFLAGLIHDVGKIILDEYCHDEFLEIIDQIESRHHTFSKAEKAVLGTTHYQVAAKLLKQWQFPPKVIMQVFYHHAPWYDKNHSANSIIVYLANILTKLAGYSCHPDEEEVDPEAWVRSKELGFVVKSGFDLDHETIQKLINHLRDIILEESDNVLRFFE